MKKLLKAEEAFQFLAGIAGLYLLPVHFSWWVWLLLFLSPDLSMAGYLAGTKTGAWTYNFFHHKGLAAIVFATGLLTGEVYLQLAGLLLFTHSCFDRMLGYGLKYEDDFQHTHLGMIGKRKN